MTDKFKNSFLVFILIIPALWIFGVLPLYADTGNLTPDVVSICNRTEQVRVAIQKEVAMQRFTKGLSGEVRCHSLGSAELKNIEYLQLSEKEISFLKAGDFAGLDGLQMLDLEGNKIAVLDAAAFAGLTNLENLILARNPLRLLGDELSHLPNLKNVDFSGCKLSAIYPGAFSGNLQLQAVFLSDNQLAKLPEGIFLKNDSLIIADLARNKLKNLPSSFTSERSALKSLDLSGNKIEKLDKSYLAKLTALRVINLANNPVGDSDKQDLLLKMPAPDVNVIWSQSKSLPPDDDKAHDTLFIPDSGSPVARGMERLRFFVRAHWHLPLEIKTYFSAPGRMEIINPGLRNREERLLLRQLEEVRDAYRRAAFDFFEVQIRFVAQDSPQKAPALSYNKKKIGLVIILKATAAEQNGAAVISDDQILNVLADSFSRSRSIAWFKKETPGEIEAVLRRDFRKVARMDDELRFDIIRLDDLIDTVMERMKEADEKKFFSDDELTDARFIQFRVLLTFQRLENTMARWRLAEDDPQFPYRSEVRLLLSEASEMYRTYLDWFLKTVVGGRATINVFSETWYHRNPIFKILDSEVPAGFFNIEGRISTRIPSGAVRELLRTRLNMPLLHYLHSMQSLDEKVSAADIKRSPLALPMTDAVERIRHNRETLFRYKISDMRAFKELWDARVKNTVNFPLYRVTMGLAIVIGDTRLANPAPAITDEQMKDMKSHLQPGDLLIERTDHYLSNAFLGGFWPHGILYLGPREEWSKLRLADGTMLADDPWIAKNILPNYKSAKDDRPALVLEAISEGVVFNSLEEAAQKDYIAIFRPKFAPAEREAKIAAAIKRALRYHGRPYDFGFDFFTDDKLVCTELLYRAYHPDINFLVQKQAIQKPDPPVPGMIKKAGRDTMPAGEIVKLALYMLDHKEPNPAIGYAGQTLEFVRLYMKEGKDKPARVFKGEQGIKVLQRTLR